MASPGPSWRCRCHAKINLTLEVLRRRPDGYHDLASLVHTISLADDLRIDLADELRTHVTGLDIDPDANLVSRAARLLAATMTARRGAELQLAKRIPAAAGLGGGSSDAAAALVGLDALWATRLRPSELVRLAGQLGADVPFFLRGGAALMRGRGDDLRALPPLTGQWLVLVVPPHDLVDKTRRLYGALEPADFSSGEASERAAACLEQRQPLRESDLVNAFARAARAAFPELSTLWAAVERAGDRRFCLSGAGPALFALAEGRADARRLVRLLQPTGAPCWAVHTTARARAATEFAANPCIGYA